MHLIEDTDAGSFDAEESGRRRSRFSPIFLASEVHATSIDNSISVTHVDGNSRLLSWQVADQGGAFARNEGTGLSFLHQAGNGVARAPKRLHADDAAG